MMFSLLTISFLKESIFAVIQEIRSNIITNITDIVIIMSNISFMKL